MPVHPSTSTSPSTPRLTDQALVAVHVATSLASGSPAVAPADAPPDRGPNVAHLLAGLTGSPEGMAATALRQRFGEVAPRITLHPALGAASLPPLRTAYVALPVVERPSWTLELLQAARRVGGEDLDHLLQGCGLHLAAEEDELAHRMPSPIEVAEDLGVAETYGRMSLLRAGFSEEADLAIARTRASGGDSRVLLAWLGADEATRSALQGAPAVPVDAVVDRASLGGGPAIPVEATDLVTAITHLSLRAALHHP